MKLLKSITTPDGGELFAITRDAESIKNKYSDNDYMNAHDINALKGALYQLIRDAQESFEIPDAEGFQALISAAICDNKLYLNSFNGHEINYKRFIS